MTASIRKIASAGSMTVLACTLLALCLSGCSGNKVGDGKDKKPGGETDLRQAVVGKWSMVSDKPAEKETTLDITADKWVWNNPASLAKDITTMTYTYTLSGDRLERTPVSKFKSAATKSKIHVADDIMTETVVKEENKHLYGPDKGEVITKYKRIK